MSGYILDKHIIYVNSRNRISGTDSNFSYLIDLSGTQKNFDKVVVLSAIIHKSYYLIDSSDTFTLVEGLLNVSISIDPGNYNRRNLASTVQEALNSASPNNWNYSISFSSPNDVDTGKYTFTVTGNTPDTSGVAIQPQFIFGNSFYQQLGFDKNSINTFVSNTLISTDVINLQIEDSLFIHSDICQNSGDNILQEIIVSNTTSFGSVTFQNPTPDAYSKKITTNSNNVYNFYLTDEDGFPIDLNGQNIVFTLMLYKENDLYKLLKDFAKYIVSKDNKIQS